VTSWKAAAAGRLGGDVGGERYVLAHQLVKRTGDRDAVWQELLDMFLAAHDGAAIALTSVVFDLARHPAVWARLRKWPGSGMRRDV
jgi:cytochrome P450